MATLLIVSDRYRRSYDIVGEHYKHTFERLGHHVVHLDTPKDETTGQQYIQQYRPQVIFHNTLGAFFCPIKGTYNVAMPLHEWDRYPENWVKNLHHFNEIWVFTHHIECLLSNSGVTAPIYCLPAKLPLTSTPPSRRSYHTPFRFLSIGEAHFRKGFHLLVNGFMRAFPKIGTAHLHIKTSVNGDWTSPREDIVFDTRELTSSGITELYTNADAYVSSSLAEGIGLPIIEAAAHGLPVVTHTFGGHADLLIKGSFVKMRHKVIDQPFCSRPEYYAVGQRCALSHPDAIASALLKIYQLDDARRHKMSVKAHRHVVNTYGDTAAAHIQIQLQRILSGR